MQLSLGHVTCGDAGAKIGDINVASISAGMPLNFGWAQATRKLHLRNAYISTWVSGAACLAQGLNTHISNEQSLAHAIRARDLKKTRAGTVSLEGAEEAHASPPQGKPQATAFN